MTNQEVGVASVPVDDQGLVQHFGQMRAFIRVDIYQSDVLYLLLHGFGHHLSDAAASQNHQIPHGYLGLAGK